MPAPPESGALGDSFRYLPTAAERFDEGCNRYQLPTSQRNADTFNGQRRSLCRRYLKVCSKAVAVPVVGDFQLSTRKP